VIRYRVNDRTLAPSVRSTTDHAPRLISVSSSPVILETRAEAAARRCQKQTPNCHHYCRLTPHYTSQPTQANTIEFQTVGSGSKVYDTRAKIAQF